MQNRDGKVIRKHDDKTRLEVASLYAISGNIAEVSRQSGVSRPTITAWRDEAGDDWLAQIDLVRQQISSEILSNQLAAAKASGLQLLDRIENGDIKVMSNGSTHTVPMTGKDLAVVNGIQIDKARTAQALSNSHTSSDSSMQTLNEQLKQLADTLNEKKVNVIKTIDKNDSDNNTNEND